MGNKLSVSKETQPLINVERLLAQIGMLKNSVDRIRFEWYPEELKPAIAKFSFDDMNAILSELAHWIETNVDEEYY